MIRHSLLLSVALACACSDPAPSPAVDASTSENDGGADASGAPDAGGADAATLPFVRRFGSVGLARWERDGETISSATASFMDTTLRTDVQVIETAIGSCVVRVELLDFALGFGGNAESGAIEIASEGREVIEITTTEGAAYEDERAIAPPFTPGETLSIAAAGGTVPAFDAELTFPAAIEFTTPADPGVDRVPIAYGAPYAVTWTPAASGFAYVGFSQQSVMAGTARTAQVGCRFPAADGAATIPAEVMLALSPSAEGVITSVSAGGSEEVDLTAGEYRITVSASFVTRSTAAWVM
jgi:hypothetical protein